MATLNETTPVAAGFRWVATAAGRALVCTALDPIAQHVFTSRDLNFASGPTGPDYDRLALVFALGAGEVVRVRQVHGRVVCIVRPGDVVADWPAADAIVSTDPTRAIAIRMADCVPILLADTKRRLVAAVHAGWRGTAANVCGATIEVMASLGVPATDVIAVVGPSIGPCCYQVDATVKEAFADVRSDRWFTPDAAGRWRLDLWAATADQLEAAGVPPGAVHTAALCTAHHLDVCYSFRKEGTAGRLAAAIKLTPSV